MIARIISVIAFIIIFIWALMRTRGIITAFIGSGVIVIIVFLTLQWLYNSINKLFTRK